VKADLAVLLQCSPHNRHHNINPGEHPARRPDAFGRQRATVTDAPHHFDSRGPADQQSALGPRGGGAGRLRHRLCLWGEGASRAFSPYLGAWPEGDLLTR